MSFLYWVSVGAGDKTRHTNRDIVHQHLSKKQIITFLSALAVLLFPQPGLLLAASAAGYAAGSCSACCQWLSSTAAPQTTGAQLVSLQGVPPSQAQAFASVLGAFHKVPACPFF